MTIGGDSLGFTIIETLIVLAVGGFLLVSTVLMFTANRRQIEFRHSVQDIETKFQDIINDTVTGYFDALKGFRCTAGSGGNPPTFSSGGDPGQGANQGCIFIGKAVLLKPDAQPNSIEVRPVVGNRQIANREVQTFAEASPITIYSPVEMVTRYTLKSGVQIKSANPSYLGGFYGSFAHYSAGSSSADSGALKSVFYNHGPLAARDSISVRNCIRNTGACYGAQPATSWEICFEAASGSNLTAKLTIDARSLTTKLEMIACT